MTNAEGLIEDGALGTDRRRERARGRKSGDRVMGRTSGYLSIIKPTLSSLLSTLDLSLDFHLPQTDIFIDVWLAMRNDVAL